MRALTKALGLFAMLGSATVLHADSASPTAAAPSAAAPVGSAPMSSDEMAARASEMMAQSQNAYRTVVSLKEKAQRQKDVIKLNCVNYKMVQIKAQLDIADNENQDLQVALDKGTDARVTTFSKLSDTSATILRLRDEAGTCIGEPELSKQETGVTVTHPDLPDDPTSGDPFALPVEPPAYASPFR